MAMMPRTTNQIITMIILTNQQQARGGLIRQIAVTVSTKLNKI